VGIDAHVDVDVGQQLQFVVVDFAEQFADATRARATTCLGDHLGFAHPGAVGQSVPGDAHGLAGFQAAKLGLVDEGAHANFMEIGISASSSPTFT